MDFSQKQKLIKEYFLRNNVTIICMGKLEDPLIVDKKTGEALNCSLNKNRSGLNFKFNAQNKKLINLDFCDMREDKNFNFQHWFNTSSKKKIYIFKGEKNYFQRYNVEKQEFVTIFTPELEKSYFVFRIEQALLFQRKMCCKGTNLTIIRKWEN